jgi:glycosyltransferase involved in cell wall biosynthesis
MRPPRVAVFSELPTPYRWPVYRRLLERPELDLSIYFLAGREPDRDWSFEFEPGRQVRFLPGHTASFAGSRTVHYHVNPGVFGVLARGAFDVVVFPGWAMFASQTGSLWCRAHGRRYIVFSETHGLTPRPPARRLPGRAVASVVVGGASAFLAASRAAADHLVGLGARRERIFLFPNSPDVRALVAAAAAARSAGRLHRAGERVVVLYVGRLIAVKRVDLAIGAVAALRGGGAPVELWIAGDGPERAGLAMRAARVLGDAARFLGTVGYESLPGLYTSADVVVLPSDHEPFGAVVGEAMACGVPVVVSDRVGAGPDLVVPGVTGSVFGHGDVDGLAAALRGVLWPAGRRESLGRAAAEHVARFDHETCAENFRSAVRAALGA